MTLETQQELDVRQWLKNKKVSRECLACGHANRQVGDIIAPPVAPHGGGTVIGGPSFGMVQVVCDNCGYVMLFNSTQVGLVGAVDSSQWTKTNAARPN